MLNNTPYPYIPRATGQFRTEVLNDPHIWLVRVVKASAEPAIYFETVTPKERVHTDIKTIVGWMGLGFFKWTR